MIGLGTIINTAGIALGGAVGYFFGRFFKERLQQTLNMACGVSVLCIGVAGTMEGMLSGSGRSTSVTLCLVLGGLIGESVNIEGFFERCGEWLKVKTGNGGDNRFTEGFVTASLTVCIGAMAVVGSIEDGIYGDPSVLITKAVLDLIIVLVMTCSMGIGCAFSAVPVAVLEGLMTLAARLLKPLMTEAALANLSLIGSILIFCVGVNLVFGKRIRVANMLPGLVIAVGAAFIPS